MKYEMAVKKAANAAEAMAIIARGIDEILAQRVGSSDDGWLEEGWGKLEKVAPATGAATDPTVAFLRDMLMRETDADERRALEAKLRLATDNGQAPPPEVPEGHRAVFDADGNVILPPPSEAQRHIRSGFLDQCDLTSFITSLNGEELRRAFIEGGPLWLYHFDRAAVMQMPLPWRQAFINDILEHSPAEAQEVARDILKDESPNTMEVTLEALTIQSEQNQ